MASQKCINDFSASSSANIRTGPEMNVGDGNFELKPTLINMVQQSRSVGRLRRMSMPIFSISWGGDLQHIYHPRNHLGRGTSPPFSILVVGEGKGVVLRQQGSCVHLGEVLQCISPQVFSVGQD
jgi:hypothetical protein